MAMKTVYSKRNFILGLGTSAPQLKAGKNEDVPEELLQGWYIPALVASGDIRIEDQKPAIYNHDNVEEIEVVVESDKIAEIAKEVKEEEKNSARKNRLRRK